MHSNSNQLQVAPAAALTQLLLLHPDVTGLTWTVTPEGVLRGERTGATDNGRAVERCAEIMGGTPVRLTLDHDGDRMDLVQFTTVWDGIPVDVWATSPENGPRPPLGELVVLPEPEPEPVGGGAR